MAEDFKFIGPAVKQQDGEESPEELYRFLAEARDSIATLQRRLVDEGLGGGGAGGRQVYLTDSKDMLHMEAPVQQLYHVRTNSFIVDDSETGGFWTAIDNNGITTTDSWDNDAWKTVLNVTECRGVIAHIVGPIFRDTVTEPQFSVEITLDNVIKRTHVFTHYHASDGSNIGTRIVFSSALFGNWAGATTSTAGDASHDTNMQPGADLRLLMDETSGKENLYYNTVGQFRLMQLGELQRMGAPLLSFRKSCLIRMRVDTQPVTGGSGLQDNAGVEMYYHKASVA